MFAEHQALGGWQVKGARLRYLRDLWLSEARALPGIEVLTPTDPRLSCGIASFRFRGVQDQQGKIAQLLSQFNIFTVARDGSACGPCIRVTPGINTTPADMRALIAALKVLSD